MPGFHFGDGLDRESNTVETVRSHRWVIEKLGPIDEKDGLGGGNHHTYGAWYAKSFGFPDQSSKIESAQGAGIEYKFAGNTEFSNATVVFYDTIIKGDTSTRILLERWCSDVRGGTEEGVFNSVGLADVYKDTSVFSMRDGSGSPIFTITLVNSWPQKISHSELSYVDSEISEVTVELVFDWYTTSEQQGGASGPVTGPPGT